MDLKTPPVILNAQNIHLHTIIWLHGLGADGHDFAPLAANFNFKNTRFIFPHAKHRPISINNGMIMRGWYDIYTFDRSGPEDGPGILESSLELQKLIQKEINSGVRPEHIFLAGFSQGGVICLHAGLSFNQKLGGILALSTYLPASDLFKKNSNLINLKTPILICHGDQDSILPLGLAERNYQFLKSLNYENLDFKVYPMDHSVCPEEIIDIKKWFQSIEGFENN